MFLGIDRSEDGHIGRGFILFLVDNAHNGRIDLCDIDGEDGFIFIGSVTWRIVEGGGSEGAPNWLFGLGIEEEGGPDHIGREVSGLVGDGGEFVEEAFCDFDKDQIMLSSGQFNSFLFKDCWAIGVIVIRFGIGNGNEVAIIISQVCPGDIECFF